MTKKIFLLASDIGGTNSRLALYSTDSSTPLYVNWYSNSKYLNTNEDKFVDIINLFLDDCSKKPFLADINQDDLIIVSCFACAGPVIKNSVVMTNVGGHDVELVIDGNEIENCNDGLVKHVKRAKIINDFVAQGYGALDLDLEKETVQLTPDSISLIDPLGPKVCVGAGTGLGECFLTINSLNPEAGYECYPSEGGHVEYSPRTDLDIEMFQFLRKKFAHKHRISVERVVSGPGIANIYEFLSHRFPDDVDPNVHAEFLAAGDMQGKVVSENAKDGNICHRAMEMFATTYGCEVGNAAMKWIPTGGLYVTGGLTPKNLHFIEGPESSFMNAYHDKGRISSILDTIPLFAIKEEDLGLRGARVAALREFKNFDSYHD